MTRLFVLVKRKGGTRFIGAIPARRGVTLSRLRKSLRGRVAKGFQLKIVDQAQLKRMVLKLKVATRRKRVVRQKKVVRRKTVRRKKRR